MKPLSNLSALYAQIEEVCLNFREIRNEAKSILQTSHVPNATLHLNDVLQSTEDATLIILEATATISGAAQQPGVSEAVRCQIAEQVDHINAACGFQDISGQRIKKVLKHLATLENQLMRLSDMAKGQMKEDVPATGSQLMNGPQLAVHAPSQADIDKMFGTS